MNMQISPASTHSYRLDYQCGNTFCMALYNVGNITEIKMIIKQLIRLPSQNQYHLKCFKQIGTSVEKDISPSYIDRNI